MFDESFQQPLLIQILNKQNDAENHSANCHVQRDHMEVYDTIMGLQEASISFG